MIIPEFPASFLISLAISVLLIPVIIRISHKRGWYDQMDHRKIHNGNIPRLGGVGIFLGFTSGALFCLILSLTNLKECALFTFKILIFFIAVAGIHITGLIDDFKNMRPRDKFIIQILAAILAAGAGIRFHGLNILFTDIVIDFPPLSFLLTIIWIVGVCNAVNLIDGLDGLSSTISLIAALSIGFIAIILGFQLTAILAFSLAGGILGFFIYNKPPARIFMGDSGSLMIGFILATLPLLEMSGSTPRTLIFAITILLIPITDTLFAITRRLIRKKAISTPDREHLHHSLLDLGFSNWKILILIALYTFILGSLPFLYLVAERKWAEVVMVALWAFTFWLFYYLHKLVRENSS